MNPHNLADKDQEITRLTALVGKMREIFDRYECECDKSTGHICDRCEALALTPDDMGELVRKEDSVLLESIFGVGWPYTIKESLKRLHDAEEATPAEFEGLDELPEVIRALVSQRDDVQKELSALRAKLENAWSALGLSEPEGGDLANEISRIRDEGRGHFHTVTNLQAKLAVVEKESLSRLESLQFIAKLFAGYADSAAPVEMLARGVKAWIAELEKALHTVHASTRLTEKDNPSMWYAWRVVDQVLEKADEQEHHWDAPTDFNED